MKSFPAIPSEVFGPLFTAVQSSGIFHDSKTFADAIPRRAPDLIMADWNQGTLADEESLRLFIDSNFTLPLIERHDAIDGLPIQDHIGSLWRQLTRSAQVVPEFGSALPLPRPFVVPGGRFRELYYWDSYFTMLGLARSGRHDLIEDMIANFGCMLESYGHIPNGARTYYLSRSHPPVLYLATALSQDRSVEGRTTRLNWLRKEHSFWMDGEYEIKPGEQHRRVVCLSNGDVLNRYWDDRCCPRDESWVEDVAAAEAAPDRNPEELWRDLRAAAESGWDFSSRWLNRSGTLGSIRTTRLIPVDLNSLLFGLERSICQESSALGDFEIAKLFEERASRRAAAINRHLWNEAQGYYADFDLDLEAVSSQLTAAAFFPLFTKLSGKQQAERTAVAAFPLLHSWGLATTLLETGQQWDAPNGWAPLQWIAYEGLRNYGEMTFANRIASSWNTAIVVQYEATGQMFEKYDVITGRAGHGGEYDVEIGFGWTNGVALAFGVGQKQEGKANAE